MSRCFLYILDIDELRVLVSSLKEHLSHVGSQLLRQLKKRDRLTAKQGRHCDVITAILQATSPKRRE